MTTEPLRGLKTGLFLATLLVAACSHAPPTKPLPASTAVPSVQTPSPPEPSAAEQAAAEAAASASEPAPGMTPEQYADLFDRIRSGFKLDDVDQAAVDQQLNWFASNPDYLERAFGRAELYLYHIVTEIERRGMPLELALLPVIESAFEPYAYSRARASGLWQFIPGTGSRFGLKQNWWYDGRRDVVESTRAALDYLQSLHDEFNGDWLLAVAAYNCGEQNVARAVQMNQDAGRPTDFWNLHLPAETRAYVPKLLAMKRLVADPESFGLAFTHIANQPYFTRVDTQGQIDLRVAAEIAGVTYDEVYELNPAFHRWATDPQGPYFLLLPSDSADAFRANVVQLTADERLKVKRYGVRSGDSVASIAHRFNTTPQVVRQLNDLPNGALVVGTELRVPAEAISLPPKVLRAAALVDSHDRRVLRPHLRVVVRRGDSLWAIARRHGVDVNALALMNGLQPGEPLRAGQRLRLTVASSSSGGGGSSSSASHARKLTYTVRDGDTLARIARVFQVTVAQIKGWNSLSQSAVRPGQRLLIRIVAQR